jgi:hypothetical protein
MSVDKIRLDNLKKKNRFVELLPFVGSKTGSAFYPNVYVPKTIYADLHSNNPSPYSLALVIHEQEHIKRMKNEGVLRFYAKYLFSGKFRFEEELAATKPQFAFIKSKGLIFDLERKARFLSGWLYLWPLKYEEALKRLNTIWDTV